MDTIFTEIKQKSLIKYKIRIQKKCLTQFLYPKNTLFWNWVRILIRLFVLLQANYQKKSSPKTGKINRTTNNKKNRSTLEWNSIYFIALLKIDAKEGISNGVF